jgi:long-chain acyl-CoA synthetase
VTSRSDPVPASEQIGSLLLEAARARPQSAAVAYGERTVGFAALARAADRLASEIGVGPGERVALVAPNVPALVVGLFAVWRAGATVVPLNARLRGFELERVFADAAPVAAVSVQSHAGFAVAQAVESAAARAPTLRRQVVLDDLGEIVGRSDRTPGRDPAAADLDLDLDPELAAILYTSGSTGDPKGALVSHRMLAGGARNLAELLGDDAQAPFGLVVPASHAFGLACLLAGIWAQATAVLVEVRSSLAPLIEAMRAHRAAVLHSTPALLRRLVRSGERPELRTGLTAGSLCPPQVLESLDERGARVLNLYGMTEIGAACSCRADDPPATRYGTVGRALPGYELRISEDPSNADLGAGPAPEDRARPPWGEIQVRSSYLPTGYHGRPWTADELVAGGWFRTGDLGRIDPAGNVSIVGRSREVVQVAGFNVFPAEVENFLLTHPGISQAAVVGLPHPSLGESLHAFVAPAPGVELESPEVIRFARAGIAGYKVPYAVSVLSELPLLPSGKPDRRELARAVDPSTPDRERVAR